MFFYVYLCIFGAPKIYTMKNTDPRAGRFRARFLLLFGGKKKGTRRKPPEQEGFPPPAGRGAQATRRRATRRAGAGARSGRETALAALARQSTFTALPSEARAAKPRGLWSE